MEAHETDVNFPQSSDQVDGQVDGIANGIMDMLDDTNPDSSGVVESRESTADEKEVETKDETPAETDETSEEPEKYTIKWQGQEKEVTQDELLDLAQKGFDYTKKTQDLATERDNLAPYVGLANQIKSNPILASQIAALISGQQQATPQAQESPKFDDPIEQLKWETKQEALAEFEKKLMPMQRMQVINNVRAEVQRDPDYQAIHAQIIDMVKSQPPSIQKTLYLQLDQDPQAYLEAFQHFKQQKATTQPTETPKPVKKETHAPLLESSGNSAPDAVGKKAQQEKISKMKAKALRSGDPMEVSKWLAASGALDHLY